MTGFRLPLQGEGSRTYALRHREFEQGSLQSVLNIGVGEKINPFLNVCDDPCLREFMDLMDSADVRALITEEELDGAIQEGQDALLDEVKVEVSMAFADKLRFGGRVTVDDEESPNGIREVAIDAEDRDDFFTLFEAVRHINAKASTDQTVYEALENYIATYLHQAVMEASVAIAQFVKNSPAIKTESVHIRINKELFDADPNWSHVLVKIMETNQLIRDVISDIGTFATTMVKANKGFKEHMYRTLKEVVRESATEIWCQIQAEKAAAKRAARAARAGKKVTEVASKKTVHSHDAIQQKMESALEPKPENEVVVGELKNRKVNSLWREPSVELPTRELTYLGNKVVIVFDYDPKLMSVVERGRENAATAKSKKAPQDDLIEYVALGVASGAIPLQYDGTGSDSVSMKVRSESYRDIPLRYQGKRSGERVYYAVTPAAGALDDYDPATEQDVICVVVVAEAHNKKAETTVLERIRGRDRKSFRKSGNIR
jgi:hypothetical protein